MNANTTQLVSAEGFDVNKIIFSKPQEGSIPDSKPAINYKRVYLTTDYGNGKSGDLIISTADNLFSFGVGINENKDTDNPAAIYPLEQAKFHEFYVVWEILNHLKVGDSVTALTDLQSHIK